MWRSELSGFLFSWGNIIVPILLILSLLSGLSSRHR
jgi:hypothetical protein